MKKTRVFLTGGTGFFGKNLLMGRPAGVAVTVLSRDSERFLRENPAFRGEEIDFIAGDVRDFTPPAQPFDLVIHAATTSGTPVPDDEMASVIAAGTERVLAMDFDRILYVSSGAVYGPLRPADAPVPETHPLRPQEVYGQGKMAAEQMVLASGREAVVARCFAFVGPHLPLDGHFAIGNFIRDCLANRPIEIKGDGRPRRSYLYAADLAEWLWTMLLAGRPGEVYNVGSDRAVSIRELAETVRRVAGASNEIRVLAPPGDGPEFCYVPDIAKARRDLNLTVKTGLEDAIRKTLEFHAEKN